MASTVIIFLLIVNINKYLDLCVQVCSFADTSRFGPGPTSARAEVGRVGCGSLTVTVH